MISPSPLIENDLISQSPAPIINRYTSLHSSNQEREAPPEIEFSDLILIFAEELLRYQEEEKIIVIKSICEVLGRDFQPDTPFDFKDIPNEKQELVYQMLKKASDEQSKVKDREDLSLESGTKKRK
jgi:hypothetical protein